MRIRSGLFIFGVILVLPLLTGCAAPERQDNVPVTTMGGAKETPTPMAIMSPTVTPIPTATATPTPVLTEVPMPTQDPAPITVRIPTLDPGMMSPEQEEAAEEFLQKLEVGKLVELPERFSYDINGDGVTEEVVLMKDISRTGSIYQYDFAFSIDGTVYVLTKYCNSKKAYGILVRPGCFAFVLEYDEFEDNPSPWREGKNTDIFYYNETKELKCISSISGIIREFHTARDYDNRMYVSGFQADVEIQAMAYLIVKKEYVFSKIPLDPMMELPYRYHLRVVERPSQELFYVNQENILCVDLPIYKNIYSDEILTVLPAGSEVFWSATDGVEWMYVDSFGTCGWIRFHGENVILNGEEVYWPDVFFYPASAG